MSGLTTAPQMPQISMPGWVFCMSCCADFEFRVAHTVGDGHKWLCGVGGLAAKQATVCAAPLRHSVGSPPNCLDKGLPVRTRHLGGRHAKARGPYQKKSDRVAPAACCSTRGSRTAVKGSEIRRQYRDSTGTVQGQAAIDSP